MIDTISSKTQTNKKRIAISPCHNQKSFQYHPSSAKKNHIRSLSKTQTKKQKSRIIIEEIFMQ